MSETQDRTPAFIVWHNNRGMGNGLYYAYRAFVASKHRQLHVQSVNGLCWMATHIRSEANLFTSMSEARDAQTFFKLKFSHNSLTEYGIERVDLYDGILDDIDNLSLL